MLLYGHGSRTEPVDDLDRCDVPVDEGASAVVRERLEATLGAWGHEALLDPARVAASEVVTLLLAAGCGSMELVVSRHPSSVTVELRCGHAERRIADVICGVDRGRGLGVIEGLVPLWGVRPTADGDAVWFELR